MARELPIFPLPIVLFPGSQQPLHIFEPRYRQMVVDCQEGDERFGIVYVPRAEPGAEADPSPGDVGCVALIRSIEPLPDGRANILTLGERRFELEGWIASDRPYRVGSVAEFDDDPPDSQEAGELAGRVRAGFARLARALGEPAARLESPALADDPELLSFQVAAALELEIDAQRALQATRDTTLRLRRLATLLGPLAAAAEQRAAVQRLARGNGRKDGGRHPEIEPTT